MRIRFVLTVVSAALFGAGFAIQACGSTTNDAVPGAADAGTDAFEAGIKDTSVPDVLEAAPPCDPNADILANIMDASIADGGSSVGLCLGCAKSKCSAEINACKMDCACQDLAGTALECFAKTQAISCVAGFATVPASTRNIGIALAGCVNQDCSSECQTAAFLDGGADADADAN